MKRIIWALAMIAAAVGSAYWLKRKQSATHPQIEQSTNQPRPEDKKTPASAPDATPEHTPEYIGKVCRLIQVPISEKDFKKSFGDVFDAAGKFRAKTDFEKAYSQVANLVKALNEGGDFPDMERDFLTHLNLDRSTGYSLYDPKWAYGTSKERQLMVWYMLERLDKFEVAGDYDAMRDWMRAAILIELQGNNSKWLAARDCCANKNFAALTKKFPDVFGGIFDEINKHAYDGYHEVTQKFLDRADMFVRDPALAEPLFNDFIQSLATCWPVPDGEMDTFHHNVLIALQSIITVARQDKKDDYLKQIKTVTDSWYDNSTDSNQKRWLREIYEINGQPVRRLMLRESDRPKKGDSGTR